MKRDLVTVAAFTHPAEAWLAKGRLEAAGLRVFLADEHLVSMYWLYSNLLGGVKLQVASPDVEAAAEVLAQVPGPERQTAVRSREGTDEAVCPRCGLEEIVWQKYSLRLAFLSWLVLGFPLPIIRRSWTCLECRAYGRRPFQYTIRTMLIVMFVFALVMGIVRMCAFDARPSAAGRTGSGSHP